METFVTDAINNNTERDCRLALSPCVAIPGGSLTLQLPTLGVVFIRLGPGNTVVDQHQHLPGRDADDGPVLGDDPLEAESESQPAAHGDLL